MMYNSKLAVAIKSGNKVLREVGDTVYLPFGSEYSLFVKNLNNVRASVEISIDGESIAGDQEFVVDANSSTEIERFLRSGNLAEGNRFKFIERTAGIENHRGVGVEDGLVRVEYRFERPRPRIRQNSLRSTNVSYSVHDGQAALDSMDSGVSKGASGITTEGSISDQQFQQVASFPLEAQSHVIVLKMMGETEDSRRVSMPVTTRTKPVCNKCGIVAQSYNAKFCSECSTSLQLVS